MRASPNSSIQVGGHRNQTFELINTYKSGKATFRAVVRQMEHRRALPPGLLLNNFGRRLIKKRRVIGGAEAAYRRVMTIVELS